MEEYEYLTANTQEAWSAIVDAIFRGDCEIKRSIVKPEGTRGLAVSVVWDRATHIENSREYRWKKLSQDVLLTDQDEIERGIRLCVVEFSDSPNVWHKAGNYHAGHLGHFLTNGVKYRLKPGCTLPPKKVKKLVNREREDFWPLIGRYWARDKKGKRFLIQNDNWVHAVVSQENWQIAPLGTEDWQPMQKEIEVESLSINAQITGPKAPVH